MSGPVKNAPRGKSDTTSSKLTDAERHKRFVEMAREVQASDDPKDFEQAFKKIVPPKRPGNRSQDAS
jgi:hypothetical protein